MQSNPSNSDAISGYTASLTPDHAAICRILRTEIDLALPHATSKIWHGSPVWFIGENPVTGYNVTAKKGINLLFWSGQLFDEPLIKPIGKFQAAGIHFKASADIDLVDLRRWLEKCNAIIWDYKNNCKPS